MGELVSEPGVVYVCVALASLLVLAEIALPTFGVAGGLAIGLSLVAGAGVGEQDLDWWPLVVVAVAVGWWAVLGIRRTTTFAQVALPGAVYAAGSITFAVMADDAVTLGLAVAASLAIPAAYPRIVTMAEGLATQTPASGAEAFVGRAAVVERWDGSVGSVRLEGSLWNATSPAQLAPGDEVTVDAVDGMTFVVLPRSAA